jgi:Zn-dependent protease
LPIPPLDGAKVLAGVLPMFLARQLYALERFSLIFIILIFLLPVGPIIIEPIKWLHQQYMTLVTFTLSPFL